MDIVKLNTRERTGKGKSYARKIRADGWIPATYYGHDRKPRSIEVDYRNMLSVVQNNKEMHIMDLDMKDEDESRAIIKDMQTDVLRKEKILHVDFQHVSMKEKVTVSCPLHIEGTPIGVSRDGGLLQHTADSLSIECLPGNIPEHITVDVSHMEVGDSIHVRDIQQEGIEIKDSEDEVLAAVMMPKQEAAEEEEGVAEEAQSEEAAETEDETGENQSENG